MALTNEHGTIKTKILCYCSGVVSAFTVLPESDTGAFLSNHRSRSAATAGNIKTGVPVNSSMRLHDRLLHLSLFAAAFFTFNTQAQEAVKDGLWSDSSTWSGGAVPRTGDIVTIGRGLDVVLDVSPPENSRAYFAGMLGSIGRHRHCPLYEQSPIPVAEPMTPRGVLRTKYEG